MDWKLKAASMTEPVSNVTGAAFLWKALGLGALVGTGVLGAIFMAAFDPPKSRKVLFGQAAVAGTSSLIFGPFAVRALDHYIGFIDLASANAIQALEFAAPVYLLLGALSWGAFAALARLRQIIAEKGGEKAAGTLGL